jgi:hypothetical protein
MFEEVLRCHTLGKPAWHTAVEVIVERWDDGSIVLDGDGFPVRRPLDRVRFEMYGRGVSTKRGLILLRGQTREYAIRGMAWKITEYALRNGKVKTRAEIRAAYRNAKRYVRERWRLRRAGRSLEKST